MKLWVDGSDHIVGRCLYAVSSGERTLVYQWCMPQSGKDCALQRQCSSGADYPTATGSGTKSGHTLTGSFSLCECVGNGTDRLITEAAKTEVTSFDTEAWKQGRLDADFTRMPGSYLASAPEETSLATR